MPWAVDRWEENHNGSEWRCAELSLVGHSYIGQNYSCAELSLVQAAAACGRNEGDTASGVGHRPQLEVAGAIFCFFHGCNIFGTVFFLRWGRGGGGAATKLNFWGRGAPSSAGVCRGCVAVRHSDVGSRRRVRVASVSAAVGGLRPK